MKYVLLRSAGGTGQGSRASVRCLLCGCDFLSVIRPDAFFFLVLTSLSHFHLEKGWWGGWLERGSNLSFRLVVLERRVGAPALSQSWQELLVLPGEGVGVEREGMRVAAAFSEGLWGFLPPGNHSCPPPLQPLCFLLVRKPWFVLGLGGASGAV